MRANRSSLFFTAIAMVLLAACAPATVTPAPVDIDAQVAIIVAQTQTAIAQAQPPDPTVALNINAQPPTETIPAAALEASATSTATSEPTQELTATTQPAVSGGRLLVTLVNPPTDSALFPPSPLIVYAREIGSGAFYRLEMSVGTGMNQLTLEVPVGRYEVVARAADYHAYPYYFSAWQGDGKLQIFDVQDGELNSLPLLSQPGAFCATPYIVPLSPDGLLPASNEPSYQQLLKCDQPQVTPTISTQGLPELGDPDWKDTFESSSAWYAFDESDYSFGVKDGRFRIVAKQADTGDRWNSANGKKVKNFYLEAVFTMGPTCSGRDRYGLLVRAPEPEYGYVVSFSCDGYFRMYVWDNNYRAIQEWKSSEAIKKGSAETNRLGIWFQGSTIRLYANGQLLGEYIDGIYAEGGIGLMVGAPNTSGLEVWVEEIAYWNLDQ